MAGHSHFKNIMRRKGAQDAKRTKKFTKILREIISSVKTGSPDPDANPRLRSAILAARAENIPRDKIENTIKRASGNVDTENYENVRYEGYGPGGAAIIVEALTDNRNRTASEVRAAFTKFGGNMGETGSVNFMFDRVGQITYPAKAATEEKMFEAALEAGADNCESSESGHVITCAMESLGSVRDALEKQFGEAEGAKITWLPKTGAPVNEEQAQAIVKLIDMLDDSDDVQEVFCNFEASDDVLAKLSA